MCDTIVHSFYNCIVCHCNEYAKHEAFVFSVLTTMNGIAMNILYMFCGGHMSMFLLNKYQGVHPGACFIIFIFKFLFCLSALFCLMIA